MLKISDFAAIAQISTSALRYYDEAGIFKPIRVDAVTGYRYYAIEQLVQLNRILALRDYGLDLTQIIKFMNDNIPPEAWHRILRLRQEQLKYSIQTAEEQLARIEARLTYIEQGAMRIPEVVLKSVKSTWVASRFTEVAGFVANAELANTFVLLLQKHKIKLNGYTHYLYHKREAPHHNFDVEIAVPIETKTVERLDSGIEIRELGEVPRMATAVHHGSPYSIVEAYQALGVWIEKQGDTITGPCRKVCLQWSGDLNDYFTEIQFPVASPLELENPIREDQHVKSYS